jgi:hypothetical protein
MQHAPSTAAVATYITTDSKSIVRDALPHVMRSLTSDPPLPRAPQKDRAKPAAAALRQRH